MGARYSKRKGNRKIANANRDSVFNTSSPIHRTIIIKKAFFFLEIKNIRVETHQETALILPYYIIAIVHMQMNLIIDKGNEQIFFESVFYDT